MAGISSSNASSYVPQPPLTSALLGGLSDSASTVFMGAGMSNLLTSNGSAALPYITPNAAAASASVNLSA